jgi:hypothetical protein
VCKTCVKNAKIRQKRGVLGSHPRSNLTRKPTDRDTKNFTTKHQKAQVIYFISYSTDIGKHKTGTGQESLTNTDFWLVKKP